MIIHNIGGYARITYYIIYLLFNKFTYYSYYWTDSVKLIDINRKLLLMIYYKNNYSVQYTEDLCKGFSINKVFRIV